MGEIADGLINGDFDFYTGEYLGRGYGIPRTNNKSLPWEKRNKGKGDKDPKEQAYNGVKKYISIKWDGRKDIPSIRDVIKEYMGDSNFDLKQKCLEIQNDFGTFVKFINQKLKTK
jgi:hypothetical protein